MSINNKNLKEIETAAIEKMMQEKMNTIIASTKIEYQKVLVYAMIERVNHRIKATFSFKNAKKVKEASNRIKQIITVNSIVIDLDEYSVCKPVATNQQKSNNKFESALQCRRRLAK